MAGPEDNPMDEDFRVDACIKEINRLVEDSADGCCIEYRRNRP